VPNPQYQLGFIERHWRVSVSQKLACEGNPRLDHSGGDFNSAGLSAGILATVTRFCQVYKCDFLPGLGTLYVNPSTLPEGPFLAYDHAGKVVSTVYMIPLKDLDSPTHKKPLPI